MNKLLKNEQGLSLVELMAVLVIGGIILAFSTSLIVQAMNNQERITVESHLRDEADIMMALLTKDIFTLNESDIEKVECGIVAAGSKQLTSCITDEPNLMTNDANLVSASKITMDNCKKQNNCTTFALITLKDNKGKIGFEDNTLYTRNDTYTTNNKNVSLDGYYTIEQKVEPYSANGSNVPNAERISMKISFTLTHKLKSTTTKNYSRTYHNEILTVDDI